MTFPSYTSITTTFLGPTDTKGGRVKAKARSARGYSYTAEWQYDMGVEGNHAHAAEKLARKLAWGGAWVAGGTDGGGFVFVRLQRGERILGAAFEVPETD